VRQPTQIVFRVLPVITVKVLEIFSPQASVVLDTIVMEALRPLLRPKARRVTIHWLVPVLRHHVPLEHTRTSIWLTVVQIVQLGITVPVAQCRTSLIRSALRVVIAQKTALTPSNVILVNMHLQKEIQRAVTVCLVYRGLTVQLQDYRLGLGRVKLVITVVLGQV
jgi:hypothetical protein